MLRLLTLGGLSLVDDGAQVTGAASQRSRLALLAILAVAGPAGIAREKVLACLWPESEDERARHALKQAVYALRRDLGSENAIAGTATLCLDATLVSSDIRDFDDAIARGDDVAAVALHAGPFLDGVFVRGSAEFDQWAATERARIERAYLDAIGRLARAADEAGDAVASVSWWRRAAAAEPLSGRVALSLMRALAQSGDVSEAIQHARIHDAVVQGQLDSPADDAVHAFAEELRRGDWVPPARPARVSLPAAAILDAAAGAVVTAEPARMNTSPPDDVARHDTRALAPTLAAAPRRPRWAAPLVIAAAALVIVAAALIPGLRAKDAPSGSAVATRSARRVVVATFTNNTRDRTLDPIGELAADWLVRTLLEAEFEVVDSRNSSLFAFRGPADTTAGATKDPAELASRHGAATVVTGSYYRQGDTLLFEASLIDPVRGVPLHPIRPAVGPQATVSSLLGVLANRVTVAMVASVDATAGARTASVGEPPSVEAYEHASRGWEMFFQRPGDTTPVFAELRRAAAIDTTYNTPLLMRAYVLDVKEQWPLLAEAVRELEPRRGRMGRVERESMALFEADLRGDLLGRLRASRELQRLSPSNVDMALLVAVSASYLNMSALALEALNGSSPDVGINAVSPMYWSWHAMSAHTMGRYADELQSARELARRFPSQRYGVLALARAHAAHGDTAALRNLLKKSGASAPGPTTDERALALSLEAARELRAHGRPREADALFARAVHARPGPDATPDHRALYGSALYEAGDLPRAREVYASLLTADPNNVDLVGRVATIAARMGDSAMVRQADRRLADWRDPYAMGRPLYWRAHLAALLGRGTEAVAHLHHAVAAGHRLMDLEIVTLHEDRDFASLWTDSGFRELVRARSGLPVIP